MPLNPEHKRYYGAEFHRVRLQLIEEAGGEICTRCGIELARGINAAHTDHDPSNLKSLKLMCPSCHAEHDAPHRIAIQRRRRAAEAGQQWLLPEMEWAPFASFEIPGWIFDKLAQLPLFADNGRHATAAQETTPPEDSPGSHPAAKTN